MVYLSYQEYERKEWREKKIKKLQKSKKAYLKKHLWLYVFLLPALIYFAIFHYGPMYGIIMAFQNFNPIAGIKGSEFVGLKNFEILFRSDDFLRVFRNSIWISILKLLWGFPIPIILAIMLSELRMKKFVRVSQTVTYMPHFISWVVLSGILINLLSTAGGAVNNLIELFGGTPVQFLQSTKYFRSVLVISDIWKEMGWSAVVYVAAISGIDREMYEAAKVDGATMLKKIWYITLPSLAPTITVLLILRMGSVLRNGFEQIFMLYSPAVYDVADVFETYTYRIGMTQGQYSFSTAVGLFQSVVGLILVLITNSISKKVGEGGIW